LFGELLKTHRRRLGLTQEDLAAKSGLDVRSLRHLELGTTRRARRHTVHALAAALGLCEEERERFFHVAAGDITAAQPSGRPTPAQLPRAVVGFAGRRHHLDRLTTLLARPGARPSAVVISAIAGTAGVGKTALAVYWAHRVAKRFPDGQLYVNLRGFDPGGSVMQPAEAIRGFLDALGVPYDRVPVELTAQVGLFRSLLAGRRMLVLLDNARDAEQVRPLLPGAPSCLVVVTSRNNLSGLVAVEGAHQLTLDMLSTSEAHDLLAHRLGPDRLAAEPEAVDEIITRCGRLPLALVIVAARAADRPTWQLADLATELQQAGLRPFSDTDPAADVRTVFSCSYQALGREAGRLFRLLGLHPGPDISASAAASLAGQPLAQVERQLAGLTQAHLLAEHQPGRYTVHDLLRSYAVELTHHQDREPARHAALTRLLDHYTHVAHAAERLLNPLRDPIPLPLADPAPATTVDYLADDREAMNWFVAEHAVLLNAVRQAADAGLDSRAWQLAWALNTFLDRRSYWHERAAAWQTAVAAADRSSDSSAQAFAHNLLASSNVRLGLHNEAHHHFTLAVELYTKIGDLIGQASTHRNLTVLLAQQGRPDRALHHAQQALTWYQAAGHRRGTANSLNNVGWCHTELGDHAQALVYCQEALVQFEQLDDQFGQAYTCDTLGLVHHRLGNYTRAIVCYHRAIALYDELGDRYNQATTLANLGDTQHAVGDMRAARDTWQQAIDTLDDLGHPDADTVRAKCHNVDRRHNAPTEPRPSV